MSSFTLLETSAERIESCGDSFASAMTKLKELIVSLESDYEVKIGNDGICCVTVIFVDKEGSEAGLSVEADFRECRPIVCLLTAQKNSDMCARAIEGSGSVDRGIQILLRHLKRKSGKVLKNARDTTPRY